MAKSPEEMMQSMIENLAEKTGRTLDQWVALVKASGLEKHGQIVAMLKGKHGVTHGYANLITHTALDSAAGSQDGDVLVEAQYAGAKADLKPIYDALMAGIRRFGKDVELAPKKGYVSLRRKKQFATIQPSSRTRIDVGIQLKHRPPGKRLQALAGGMVSHKVSVHSLAEIDRELMGWLHEAYELAG